MASSACNLPTVLHLGCVRCRRPDFSCRWRTNRYCCRSEQGLHITWAGFLLACLVRRPQVSSPAAACASWIRLEAAPYFFSFSIETYQARWKDIPQPFRSGFEAQADLWRHSLYYLTSMALKCAVELHIPTAIHDLGGATTLPELVTKLSLPKTKLPFLGRVMRLLVTSGIFASDNTNGDGAEVVYRLNPLSWLLVEGVESEDHTYQKYFVLGTCSRHYVEAGLSLAEWFKKDLPEPLPPPFVDLHGVHLAHESTKLLDEELDRIVEEGVAAHDSLAIGTIIRECSDVFSGLHSLTYCCGRQGNTSAKAIIKAFPDIKCTVLNLPRVVETPTPVAVPADDVVSNVTGDLFHTIPPAQAVMLKLVLHFWSDEHCVKILEQCRKAIPSREEGGKVIIIEILLGPYMGPIMYEAQLLMDMLMMVNTSGRQRTENDWRQIFTKAGFSDYKVVKKIGARGVIEVYP